MSRWPFLRALRPGQVTSDEGEAIRDEIELYLELRAEELVAEGLEPAKARDEAERRFGDAARIEAELRARARRGRAKRGTMTTMRGLWQDLGYAVRTFRRNPAFATVAVLTLALAMGGNTAIFSVVDAVLLRALPFADSEELVFVNGYHLADGEIAIRGASYPEFFDWRERSEAVSPMAAVSSRTLALTGEGPADALTAEIVTSEYFEVLRVSAALGRTFVAEEHQAREGAAVAVISGAMWRNRYGASPDVLGRTIVLDDQTFEIVGVMPDGFRGIGLTADLWLPETATPVLGSGGSLDARGTRFLSVIGRLRADSLTAQRELDVIARDLQAEFPDAHEDRYAQIQDFRSAYIGGVGDVLWILLGAGAVLLLVAAANVSNLLLVRSHARTREIVLRRALGADGRRVASQLLVEGLLLSSVAAAAGLFMGWWGLRALTPLIPQGVLPGYVEVGLSSTAFLVSLGTLAVVGVAMGLVPAAASRRLDLASTLREGGRAAAGSLRRFRAQHAFVVTQVALALVLLVGAGLLARSFRAQLGVETGAELDAIAAMRLTLPPSRYPDSDSRRIFVAELERMVSEIPGVVSASISSDLPFRGGSVGAYVYRDDAPDDRIRFHLHRVRPAYFETMGIELVAGRLLAASDVADGPPVGVITQSMVQRVFPEGDAIGQTLYLRPGRESGFEVVGVIEDVRYRDLTTSLIAERNSPDVFLAYDQITSSAIEVAARVDGDPADYLAPLRATVATVDADLPVFQLEPLSQAYRAQTATPRFTTFLMGLLSSLAAVLACVGIYGVLAFTVGQRGQEIAIRRAIGASGSSVARRVVWDGLRLSVIGLAVGALVALVASRVLEGVLFGVPTTDPLTYVGVSATMILVSVVAALVPALRATRRDPAEALTAE